MLSAIKSVIRLIFHSSAAISLILCIASVFLWARSYQQSETLHWFGDGGEFSLTSRRGQFDCYKVWSSELQLTPVKFTIYRNSAKNGFEERVVVLKRSATMEVFGPSLGFAFFRDHPDYAELFIEVLAPWWFVTVTTAIMPAIWFRRWRKLRRAVGPGCCASCGYDLRATPDRCPECGAVPAGVMAS